MKTNIENAEKSIVAELDYDTKTAKRVAYSEWAFTLVGPFEIEVRNASYGHLSDDHVYRVMIDKKGRPISCTCKGFERYHGPNGRVGKHMLAVAAIGGPTLLEAAKAFTLKTDSTGEPPESGTVRDKIRADGGQPEEDACSNGEIGCAGLDSKKLSCFDCYEVPEVTR